MIIVTPPFSKSSVFKMFSVPHENEKPASSNSSGLKGVFEKLRFRDGRPNHRNKTGSVD